jgi:glycosyltransferase involved in cell wall biosynthesis
LKPTLSVIVPALNEEQNIAAAVEEVIKAIDDRFADYELLLFNDGSRDRTGEIMEQLAAANPRLRVTHNPQPRNLGGVYKQGIAMARFDYIIMAPGDNENPSVALIPAFEAIGKADIVLPYPANPQARSLARRFVSRGYTLLLNLLFFHWVKYYNGTVINRTADLRSITINTNSFAYQSEVLLKLLKAGRTYYEVGIDIQPKPGRRSNALKLRNQIAVYRALCQLFVEVHFRTPKGSLRIKPA